MHSTTIRWRLGAVYLAAVCSPVTLFVYNSGYGYDGLEVMVIARSLNDGYAFFDFIPSRPFALYYLTSFFFALPAFQTHLGVSVLIAFAMALMALACFWYVNDSYNRRTAWIAVHLLVLSALFMEMNFVMTEPFVVLFGMVAACCLTRFARTSSLTYLFLGGAALGVGFHFKQSALFFQIGAMVWIAGCLRASSLKRIARAECVSLAGLAVGVLPPIAWFVAQGLGHTYYEWTFDVPLFHFPASMEFLDKMVTKLAWFNGLLLGAILASLIQPVRSRVYGSANTWIVLCFGIFALYPLSKNQSPHYYFPSAAFFAVFVAAVADQYLPRHTSLLLGPRVLAIGVALSVAIALSVFLYRPDALGRFIGLKKYEEEEQLRQFVQGLVPREKKALFVEPDSMRHYWGCDRYPNIPLIHLDVQSAYFVDRHPSVLENALDDSDLTLVAFDPDNPPAFRLDVNHAGSRRQMWAAFHEKLLTHYDEITSSARQGRFWIRKQVRD